MIRKVLFFVMLAAILATTALPVYPQTRTEVRAKEMKAGEVIKLGEGLSVKVSRAATPSFPGVKVKGQPVIVVLQLDGGNKNVNLSYRANANSRFTEVYLESRGSKFAPLAVIEDFPSLGADNDKEIEILDPKDPGDSSVEFEGKGSLALLFDLSAAQAKNIIKLSVKLRTSVPKQEQHSFVVLL